MSNKSKRSAAIGFAAAAIGFGALAAFPTLSFASDAGSLIFAQANDTKGKSDNTGRPSNQTPGQAPGQTPGTQTPGTQAPSTGQPSSATMPNTPQTGVPARCASLTNATERQKCMDTPKGQ